MTRDWAVLLGALGGGISGAIAGFWLVGLGGAAGVLHLSPNHLSWLVVGLCGGGLLGAAAGISWCDAQDEDRDRGRAVLVVWGGGAACVILLAALVHLLRPW